MHGWSEGELVTSLREGDPEHDYCEADHAHGYHEGDLVRDYFYCDFLVLG